MQNETGSNADKEVTQYSQKFQNRNLTTSLVSWHKKLEEKFIWQLLFVKISEMKLDDFMI